MGLSRPRSSLNYGIYVQYYRADDQDASASNPYGWREALGSEGVLFLDQRLGLARMADEARRVGLQRGMAAYRLCKAYDGFRSSRPVGNIIRLPSKESLP